MNIKQLLTKKNAQYATAALLVLATVCLLPHVRSLAISLTEHLMHRSLDHAYWERFLFLQTLKACSVIGAVLVLLSAWKTDDTRNNNILVFTVTILTMFVITNINIILSGVPFTGYWNIWDFGDTVPCLPNGEMNPNVSGYGQLKNLYASTYPPLAVFLYKFFFAFFSTPVSPDPYTSNYLLTLYMFATIAPLSLLAVKWLKQNNALTMCFALSVFCTSPVLFAYQRLNILLITLVFIFIYLLGYQSKNKILKEFSLFSLAIAANIKLYPAIFGLLLIKQKKWKEAIRCALYGIILFLIPMLANGSSESIAPSVFTEAPIQQIQSNEIATSIISFTEGISYYTTVSKTYGISISAQIRNLLETCNLPQLQNIFSPISIIVTLICGIILFFLSKTRHQELLFLASLCPLIPGGSYWYNMSLILIPLYEFLNTEHEKTLFNKIELFLYILIFLFVWQSPLYTVLKPYHTHHLFLLLFLNAVLICKETDFKAIFTQLKVPKKR